MARPRLVGLKRDGLSQPIRRLMKRLERRLGIRAELRLRPGRRSDAEIPGRRLTQLEIIGRVTTHLTEAGSRPRSVALPQHPVGFVEPLAQRDVRGRFGGLRVHALPLRRRSRLELRHGRRSLGIGHRARLGPNGSRCANGDKQGQ